MISSLRHIRRIHAALQQADAYLRLCLTLTPAFHEIKLRKFSIQKPLLRRGLSV